MSKQDETPIRFDIPGPGKHSQVPIPVNQPHWRYRKDPWVSPQSALSGLFFLLTACFTLYLGTGKSSQSPGTYLLYVFPAGLFLFGLWMLYLAFKQAQAKTGTRTTEPAREPRPKKLPKHRKDYR